MRARRKLLISTATLFFPLLATGAALIKKLRKFDGSIVDRTKPDIVVVLIGINDLSSAERRVVVPLLVKLM